MNFIRKIAQRYEFSSKLLNDSRYRSVVSAVFGLIFNLIFAFYNGIIGIKIGSVWFFAVCFYYLLLCIMRFSAVMVEYIDGNELVAKKIAGALLTVTSFVLAIITYISLMQNVAKKFESITMISIATFTFIKIAMATIKASCKNKDKSYVMQTIRCITYADVAVAVFTMQRSMLVSFGDMPQLNRFYLNLFTGFAVCIFTLSLGIILLIRGKKFE